MTKRENLLSLYKRQGYEEAPVEFNLCPELKEIFTKNTGLTDYEEYFGFSRRNVSDGILPEQAKDLYLKYYNFDLKPGTKIDRFGVAHEPGSAAAKHMTYMRNPLKQCESLEDMKAYPYPDFAHASYEHQKSEVEDIHKRGLAACGNMQCTIWESAWYMRGMEELMMDMVTEDPMASYILDKAAEMSTIRATHYVEAGCDLLFFGDDIGMQHSIMMSEELYCEWIKPRLKKLIATVKNMNPNIIIIYHSCGYVEPFIPHLIDAGIDVLNPIQTECMEFKKIHEMYGDKLSFNGTIGTQTTMPFGTPEEVRKAVFDNLEIAGEKGGLMCCPTHMLEPEVPWDNIEAYVNACREFKQKK